MSTTVEDIHHRNRQLVCVQAAKKTVKRNILGCCGGLGCCQGNSKDSIGTQIGLVLSAIQLQHNTINSVNIRSITAHQSWSNLFVNIGNSLGYALAAKTSLITITKLQSLKLASGCTTWSSCTAYGIISQDNLSLNSWIATGINNLTANNLHNLQIITHISFTSITITITIIIITIIYYEDYNIFQAICKEIFCLTCLRHPRRRWILLFESGALLCRGGKVAHYTNSGENTMILQPEGALAPRAKPGENTTCRNGSFCVGRKKYRIHAGVG